MMCNMRKADCWDGRTEMDGGEKDGLASLVNLVGETTEYDKKRAVEIKKP